MIRRTPKRARPGGKLYVYLYYLYCVACRTLYLVDAAKRAPGEAAPPRPAHAPHAPASPGERPTVRLYEVALDPLADAARFAGLVARLASLGAALVRRLDGADQVVCEYLWRARPVALELHPERGIVLRIRGKRNRAELHELAALLAERDAQRRSG